MAEMYVCQSCCSGERCTGVAVTEYRGTPMCMACRQAAELQGPRSDMSGNIGDAFGYPQFFTWGLIHDLRPTKVVA